MALVARFETLEAARTSLDLAPDDLWVDYVGLGGSLMPLQLAEVFSGARDVDNHDYDILVQALNERFTDVGENRPLAYSDEEPES